MTNPSKLLVDLNILPFRKKMGYTLSTLLQTGIESYHLINSAAWCSPFYGI